VRRRLAQLGHELAQLPLEAGTDAGELHGGLGATLGFGAQGSGFRI
jgi:hypothetical protein